MPRRVVVSITEASARRRVEAAAVNLDAIIRDLATTRWWEFERRRWLLDRARKVADELREVSKRLGGVT